MLGVDLTRRSLLALLPAAGALVLAGCAPRAAPGPAPSRGTARPTVRPVTAFDRGAHSIDDPESLWVVVDKRRPLRPATYVPPDLVRVQGVPYTNPPLLRREAAGAVTRMFAAALPAGVHLVSNSTYRSYTEQQSILAQDTATYGAAEANRIDMHPGCSEHQTGWAIDIGTANARCDLDTCMAHTDEGEWLAANAWRHGFLLSYPADREHITGISFEPWHFRYVGTALAAELHRTGTQTLQEFFRLPASPTYA